MADRYIIVFKGLGEHGFERSGHAGPFPSMVVALLALQGSYGEQWVETNIDQLVNGDEGCIAWFTDVLGVQICRSLDLDD